MLQAQREIAEGIIQRAVEWDNDAVPTEARRHAQNMWPLGDRILAQVELDTDAILGPVLATNSLHVDVPDPLFFKGFEDLQPAAKGIAIDGSLPEGAALA